MFAEPTQRWILAFDASCGTCRSISRAVEEAGGGRFAVLPLQHPEVTRWRSAALGDGAPFTPTLLRVRGADDVRAWTSRRIALPLIRLLGPRATLRVLGALEQLREEARAPLSPPAPARGLSRKTFLRLGVGATIAGGLVFSGAVPALAEQRRTAAAAWVATNRTRLPQTYSAFVAFPEEYRQEIYQALSPAQRAGLWREHVAAFRAAHPASNAGQRRAYEMVERALADDSMCDSDQVEQHAQALEAIRTTVTKEFGIEQGRHLIATLGPATETAQPLADACSCSTESDWCGVDPWNCGSTAPPCQRVRRCGTAYQY
ncbi:bacteriocin fulvocin C-related protein [Streptomyces sp. ME19-01-6]|uniref:bacteriocin fulvocin C-related protein n=1 Tax=Streptomyces sp. ME19-01-6 TaxID=3028686 RepID=UPI0029B344F3|nr:bacteriocin fulvocin C-related protein [Streptomyces sp. ME19-01-6]MDX3227596.1 bacteriocin fulvocin C-related protein [Streptomyces sp. ME19-01-6]